MSNIAFPHAWRYRDYVIDAFNKDKPYDQFVREQIAGDLLTAETQQARAAQLMATGFLALGAKGLNEMNPRQFALDVADEQIDAMSQAVLGLTVACARCHDHKFDPIPQRDYYALAGIFLSTETRYGTAQGVQNRHASELIELPTSADVPKLDKTLSATERARLEARLEELKAEQRELFAARFGQRMGGRDNDDANKPPQRPGQNNQLRPLVVLTEIGRIETQLKSVRCGWQLEGARDGRAGSPGAGLRSRRSLWPALARQDAATRRPGRAPIAFPVITDSPLFAAATWTRRARKVPRGTLTLINAGATPAFPAKSSGRLELAQWLTSAQNPLTARVMANRLWHWLFGQGLVASVDNFGTMGQKPANQALLDHLATRLIENGWSMKKTIREIVLSRAYQRSSAFDEKNFAADPENTLCWRMSKRRLDAECIRDAMLAVSGQLDLNPPVGSLIARSGDGPIGGPRFRGISEDSIVNASGNFRSVYLPVPRDVLPDSLAAFDFAENSLVTGARETTNVPSQALVSAQ
jgi:cytochrome c553